MRYALIMAGGAGTRLWPMSRKAQPKQLLPFINGRSLLQIAAERLEGVVPPERRYICAAESFRSSIKSSLGDFTDDRILGEPLGRDTVNAVGFGAAVLQKLDPTAVFAVLTSDHLITPQAEFAARLDLGFKLVEADPNRLVTFSITPTFPATGFGYVEQGDPVSGFPGTFFAKRFVEKPDLARATEYIQSGNFGWNSGMFVYSAATVMKALERFKKESFDGLTQIAAAWDTPRRAEVLGAVYPTLPKISVDYALMEPASKDATLKVCIVPMQVEWKDVGSWPSYGGTLPADAEGNRSNGPAVHLGSKNVLTVTDDARHTITTIGCEDLMVIHTRDATLVCPASLAEKVKEMAGRVSSELQ